MAEQLLPLFPLSIVLLPATPLPLHIFEDRYKEMMGVVIPDRSEFGVVFAKENAIVNVGCTARVDRVLERYPDGRLDLIAIGQRRFQIISLNDDKSYLQASVEYFNDEEAEQVPAGLRDKAIEYYRQLRELESPQVIIEPELDSPQLSFQLAQFVSDSDKRQAVLSLRSEIERLEYLIATLPEYIVGREWIGRAKRLAPLNGNVRQNASKEEF